MLQGLKVLRFWKGKAAPFLILFTLLFAPFFAQAEEASVAVEVDSIAQGRPFWIAVEITPEPGQIISLIDSETGGPGVGISMVLAEGFTRGQTLLPGTTFLNEHTGEFAFEGSLVVLQEISVARNVAFANIYEFSGHVMWQTCDADGCSDQKADIPFSRPYGEGQPAPMAAGIFASARANLPHPLPWPVEYKRDEDIFELVFYMPRETAMTMSDIMLVPLAGKEGALVNENAVIELIDEGWRFTGAPNDEGLGRKSLEALLVVFGDGGKPAYYTFKAKNVLVEDRPISLSDPDLAGYTIWLALGLAFIGGILLNLMPCVFPVLTLKVFTLMKSGSLSRRQMRLDGLAYTGGILFSFLIVALLLLTFRSLGQQVGWGFQLQSPYFVVAMAIILLLVALVFLGVINIRLPFALEGKPEAEGTLGSFYTGMLATVVATPCTAPFMAPALGFALTLETTPAVAVFMGLGLGLAAPYLLVSVIPKVQSIFPKPGPWMETFKKILAIPLLLTVGWLGWVFYTQTSDERLAVSEYAVEWSPEAVWNLRLQGKGVFVNYTATWCLSCIVNERLVFKNEKFQRFLVDSNIVYMEADWTRPNPVIAASLEQLGRSGLPVYAFYPPGGPTRDVVLLPEILTLEMALERISAELE